MENVPYTLFMCTVHYFTLPVRLLFGSKIIFADTAIGAAPVIGKLLKSGSGLKSVGGIALGRIIDITADVANVLFHFLFSFFGWLYDFVNVSNVVKKSDRRRRPAVNLAPCSCAAAVMYKSTLPCCAHCKTRPCLTDASTDANKRFVYVVKLYLMCYI